MPPSWSDTSYTIGRIKKRRSPLIINPFPPFEGEGEKGVRLMNNKEEPVSRVGAIIVAGGSSQRMILRNYSLTQLRSYSLEEFLTGLHPADIQPGGTESPNHCLNELRLTELLPAAELGG